jgi:Flp pilus assembly protein TadD
MMTGKNIKSSKDKGKEKRRELTAEDHRIHVATQYLSESKLREQLVDNPTCRYRWFYLGMRLCEAEKYEEALSYFQKSLEYTPTGWGAGANIGLGAALLELGRLNEAEYYLTEALEIEPKFPQAWFNLGAVYHRMGRIEDAEKAFTEAVTLKPAYRDAWLALGRIHYDLGRNDDARKAFANIVSLDPRCTEAWMALGELLIIKGDYNKAEEIFRMLLRRNSKNGDAWYNLGTVLEHKGENDDAEQARSMAQRFRASQKGEKYETDKT